MADQWRIAITTLRDDITIIDETEAVGVRFERYVTGKTGSLTATLPAPNAAQAAQLQALARNDATLLFGAYLSRGNDLWTRVQFEDVDVTLDPRGGRAVTISGLTLEGYLDERTWDTDTTWAGVEQFEMARQIWQAALAGEGGIGVAVPAVTASGVNRDLTVLRSDDRTLRDVLDEFSHRTNGFEWMINVYLIGAERHSDLLLGYPTISRGTTDVLTFPGDLLTFTRKTTRGGTRTWARGSAPDDVDGAAQPPLLSPILRAEDILGAGAILIDRVLDETDVKLQTTLNERGVEYHQQQSGPRVYVKATVRIDAISPGILGNDVLLRVSDPIYPPGPNGAPGLESRHRVIGFKIRPDERGRSEVAELIFEES